MSILWKDNYYCISSNFESITFEHFMGDIFIAPDIQCVLIATYKFSAVANHATSGLAPEAGLSQFLHQLHIWISSYTSSRSESVLTPAAGLSQFLLEEQVWIGFYTNSTVCLNQFLYQQQVCISSYTSSMSEKVLAPGSRSESVLTP